MSLGTTFVLFCLIASLTVLGWRALDLARYIKRGY